MSNRNEKERRREERLAQERAETRRRERRKDLIWFGGSALVLVVAVTIIAVALSTRGSSGSSRAAQPAVAAAPAPKDVPRQIAASLRDGNKVVGGSVTDRIGHLKGVPIVVNQWASWCPNCKAEFGFFQQLSGRYERQVAFLGLDSQDQKSNAEAFLKQHPVNYPSVYDPSAAQAAGLGAGQAWPTTLFFDRTGRRTYVHIGGYTTAAALNADIRRYALGRT
jgi:thiol-disulfide isomerase/thioredoxin